MLSCLKEEMCCCVAMSRTVGDLIQIFQFPGFMKLKQLISGCKKVDIFYEPP